MRNLNVSSVATSDTATAASTDMDASFVNVPSNVDVGDDSGNVPALLVSTSPKHDVIGLGSGLTTTQACVNMKARDLPDDDSQRAPVDIVVALDVSGSMMGEKLNLSKKTLNLLLRVLYPEDRFGLICYSDSATIEVPAQKMTEANKASCAKKIRALRTRGSTNMSAAVGLAFQEMRQIRDPNEVQTIFFLTDGHANAGISDASGLVEFTRNCFEGQDGGDMYLQGTEGAEDRPGWNPLRAMRQRRSANKEDSKPPAKVAPPEKVEGCRRDPITMHTFGFGSDHNSSLLRAMSDVVPGGSYYFVENDANVGRAFGDALGGILSVVAQNVVVTIRVPDEAARMGVEIVDVHHDRKVKREDGSFTVVVGDFYAEESRDVLFEVKLAAGDAVGGNKPIVHADVSVAYTDTLKKALADANSTACLISRPTGNEISACNHHVNVQWTRVAATRAMSRADEMARANDVAGARAYLSSAQMEVRAACQATPAEYGASLECLDSDMTVLTGTLTSASVYRSRGAHTFQTSMAGHCQQRSMHSAPNAACAYGSRKKNAMAKKFAF